MKRQGLTKHDLAFYLSPEITNFVRPGLTVTIKSATINSASKVVVHFTITDLQGLPLDRLGVDTPGTVSTSWVLGYIPKGGELYTSYISHSVTSVDGKTTAIQATSDSGGTYTTNADGDYLYTFGNALPAGYDQTVTTTVGTYASRNLTTFSAGTQYSNSIFSFVPNGSAVTVVRDIVETATCNGCHDPLAVHGGSRQDVRLCIICHNPGSTDPSTGNTVDFTTMIHKIHMGSSLPSVVAGGKYQIVGFNNSVNDFSTVIFPNYIETCTVCHVGGTQSNLYLTNPSRRACGSCHDNVNFASGLNHVNLPQPDDTQCTQCHIPQGPQEFDASITGAHTNPLFSNQLPGTTFKLIKVTNNQAGQKPTVVFTVNDAKGNVITASTMSSLSLVLAGPTTDYGQYVSESAKGATLTAGQYFYTFTNAIPAGSTGTWAVGIEGYNNININPGTTIQQTVRDSGFNQVIYFAVDGTNPVTRRAVVAMANCNGCHGTLAVHGGMRRNTEYCVLCHNPNQNDSPTRPAAQAPYQTVHFKTMIHKIHRGTALTTDYTIIGFGGSSNNFNGIRFPGDLRDCTKCHLANTNELPLPAGVLNTQTPRDWITPTTQPMTAACVACHDPKSTSAHALSNTSSLGESCDVCHGPSGAYSVDQVHAR
jgi:OmcA/MtrC family decaheme c-type cytochrome